MTERNLSDAQWCFLDLLVRARQKGVHRINRMEILNSTGFPGVAKVQLVFAGLLLANGDLVAMHGAHDFEITDEGLRAFNEKYGSPTRAADVVIALPDNSKGSLQ